MHEMKDSGSKCTKDIPKHWKYCKILYVLSMRITDGPHETPEAVSNGIPFVSAEAVSQGNGSINFDYIWGYISQEFYEECCKKYVPQIDDIYMIKSGATTGKVAIVDTDRIFTIWSPLAVLRTNKKKMVAKYLYFYLQSDSYQQQVELGWNYGTQQNIGMRTIEKLKICVPPINEQHQIVSYLDAKCDAIDKAIAHKRSVIEKLKEYRTAVITKVVTKGLNPDAEMKSSGNQCTEDIPEHWDYCKILYVLSMRITDGPHETPEAVSNGIPFVSAEAVSQGNGSINFDYIWGYISQEFYEQCCKKYIPQVDDIYMIKSGATTGKIAIVDTDRIFTIWSPLAVLRTNKKKMIAKYLFYYLQSNSYQQQVELGWNYGTQQNIGMRTIEKLKICVPPIIEQQQIVDYLDDKCNKIDVAIQQQEQAIAKLEEYRKSVIYYAVTGKIDCGKAV